MSEFIEVKIFSPYSIGDILVAFVDVAESGPMFGYLRYSDAESRFEENIVSNVSGEEACMVTAIRTEVFRGHAELYYQLVSEKINGWFSASEIDERFHVTTNDV